MKSYSLVLGALLVCAASFAQEPAEAEERALQQSLAEAGTSPVDFLRALEGHLAKFPNSARRTEIERALVKAAIEARDERRTILYGEKVLLIDRDDLQVLDRVTRALLATEDRERAGRALKYARHSLELLHAMEKEKPAGRMGLGRWREELDRGLGRALVLDARATGNLGKSAEAAELARKSYETFPTLESAREAGKWLVKSGKIEPAVQSYAEAFALPDPRSTDAEKAAVRVRLGELYRQWKGAESGLGDLVLAAYDRTTALLDSRRLRLKQLDPNAEASAPLDFTLTGLDGGTLALASLKGKVVVMDFWATWCGPCRAQHPLYEEAKKRFQSRPEVVFLSINTDEDRGGVAEFLAQQKWDKRVYFEDGLSAKLRVSSIPTTILLNKRGDMASRMNGFIPERFVAMLIERIEDALRQ